MPPTYVGSRIRKVQRYLQSFHTRACVPSRAWLVSNAQSVIRPKLAKSAKRKVNPRKGEISAAEAKQTFPFRRFTRLRRSVGLGVGTPSMNHLVELLSTLSLCEYQNYRARNESGYPSIEPNRNSRGDVEARQAVLL